MKNAKRRKGDTKGEIKERILLKTLINKGNKVTAKKI